MNKEVVCCFCGNSISIKNAAFLSIQSNIEAEESQGFFSHKECLKSVLDKSVVDYLHPEILF